MEQVSLYSRNIVDVAGVQNADSLPIPEEYNLRLDGFGLIRFRT